MNQTIQDKLNEHFKHSTLRTYAKGEVLIQAGEGPQGVMQLLEGTVEQYDITPEGNMITVNIFKPPAFFPMSWAINKTPNVYFFSALTPVKLRVANANETVTFLQSNPDVMFDLLSRLYKGTDALLKRHVVLARGIASSRLIFELLIESYRFGNKLNDAQTLISIKHASLAARSGLARETVSRELHKLEKENLLTLEKRGITINTEQLELKLNTMLA